jgi:hypothetical protein
MNITKIILNLFKPKKENKVELGGNCSSSKIKGTSEGLICPKCNGEGILY